MEYVAVFLAGGLVGSIMSFVLFCICKSGGDADRRAGRE